MTSQAWPTDERCSHRARECEFMRNDQGRLEWRARELDAEVAALRATLSDIANAVLPTGGSLIDQDPAAWQTRALKARAGINLRTPTPRPAPVMVKEDTHG